LEKLKVEEPGKNGPVQEVRREGETDSRGSHGEVTKKKVRHEIRHGQISREKVICNSNGEKEQSEAIRFREGEEGRTGKITAPET